MYLTKMHGIGNDYLYLYNQQGTDFPDLARKLSPRHKGIGADGVIHIASGGPEEADFTMSIYNADGSEGEMCGNGIRCVGKYVYDNGHTDKEELKVWTLAGMRILTLFPGEDGKIDQVTVAMGCAKLGETQVLELGNQVVQGVCVSVGNPHFVVEWQDLPGLELEKLGTAIQNHPLFQPEGVNVEFYTPGEESFTMRVWERGSGETLACGTGACACFAVASARYGWQGKVLGNLLGGQLELWQEEQIMMKGSATTIFQGDISF